MSKEATETFISLSSAILKKTVLHYHSNSISRTPQESESMVFMLSLCFRICYYDSANEVHCPYGCDFTAVFPTERQILLNITRKKPQKPSKTSVKNLLM